MSRPAPNPIPLLLALCFVLDSLPIPAITTQAQSTPGILDSLAPSLGTVTAPAAVSTFPIQVQYNGVDDSGIGTVQRIELWARVQGHPWTTTDHQRLDGLPSGTFAYTPSLLPSSPTTYHFQLVVQDNWGNRSPEPSGLSSPGAASTTVHPVAKIADWMLY